LKFSIKKTVIAGLITASLVAASLIAAVPAFAANPSSLTLQSESVANGATFNVTLSASTTAAAAAAGGQAYITFNPADLTCNSAIYAGSKADKQDLNSYFGAGEFDVTGTINNTTGNINALTSTNGGSPNPSVNGTGTWVTLNFTAKSAANNSNVTISLVSGTSFLANSAAQSMPTDLNNGTITVGTIPTPDYSVINAATSAVSGTPTEYNVTFNIKNVGTFDPGATTQATVTPVGETAQNITVPDVATSATSAQLSVGPFTLGTGVTNVSITISITPLAGDIDTTDKSATTSYSYLPPNGKNTSVNGNIVGTLSFTQPASFSFGNFTVGANNQVVEPFTVVSNEPWMITASGANNGYMTAYSSTSGYDIYTKLGDALNISAGAGYMTAPSDPSMTAPADYDFNLTGTAQTFATGIPAGQNADGISGETRNAIFNQQVLGSDAALSGTGYTYNITVTFIATANW
jgi:hypothetical protein